MRITIRIATILACCWLCGVVAHAQNIYGFTSLDYDDVNDVVIAECQTVADYSSASYYTVYVDCSIVDNDHVQVAYASASDSSDGGSVDVVIEADVTADASYTATSRHNGDIYYYDWDSSCGYARSCYSYYDVENLSYYNSQVIDDLRAMDAELSGPQQVVNQQRLHAGNTHDATTPPVPTVIKVKSWCPGGHGALLEYWVLNGSGGISRQGWYVVEQQTDTSLTTSTTFGPGTSYQKDDLRVGDKFDDDIGDLIFQSHISSQTFFVTKAISGTTHYPLTILWFGPVNKSANAISISSANVVNINGDNTSSSCRYP